MAHLGVCTWSFDGSHSILINSSWLPLGLCPNADPARPCIPWDSAPITVRQKFARTMLYSARCNNYVRNMPGLCQKLCRNLSELCQNYTRAMSEICQNSARTTSEMCKTYTRTTQDECQNYFRNLPETCQNYVRHVSEV